MTGAQRRAFSNHLKEERIWNNTGQQCVSRAGTVLPTLVGAPWPPGPETAKRHLSKQRLSRVWLAAEGLRKHWPGTHSDLPHKAS